MKYYGVRVGRVPGVYQSWPEVQQQTNRYPKASFKSFSNYQEAYDFAFPAALPAMMQLTIYCDGSFKNNKMGYATICVETQEQYYGAVVGVDGNSNNVAELYAIQRSIEIFGNRGYSLNIHTDSLLCINLLQGGYNAHANQELVQQIKSLLTINPVTFIHVYGHQGNVYNEYVDRLANLST